MFLRLRHYVKLLIRFVSLFLSSAEDTLREGKGGRKRGRETLISCLLYVPWLGTELTTQVCALSGDGTCTLPSMGWCCDHPSHASQGCVLFLLICTANSWYRSYSQALIVSGRGWFWNLIKWHFKGYATTSGGNRWTQDGFLCSAMYSDFLQQCWRPPLTILKKYFIYF